MKAIKLCAVFLLLTALLFGCVTPPPATTEPPVTTTVPGTTAAPTDPTQGTTAPPVTTAPPTEPPATTVPPTTPPETTAPPTEPPATTVPPTEPVPTECRHEYQTETAEPTCTGAGQETQTCIRCGRQVTKTLPATGHTYGAGTVLSAAATCADTGTIRYSCGKCGHSYDTAYRGNHRFGEPFHGSPHGYQIECQDCGYRITDFYTWFENGFSDCDKTAALYTDTIRLKEPAYTGPMSQWSETFLDWHDLIMTVLQVYGVGEDGGVMLGIDANLSDYGGTEEAFLAEVNRFLDAFQAVYGWRPVWTEKYVEEGCVYLGFDTATLMPLYRSTTDNMSSEQRNALVEDLVAFHIHRMGLRSGMQVYNSVGVICDYMQYNLLSYDHNFGYNSAFRGLTSGVTMCQGYSEIFQLFADYCGINCRIVEGTLQGRGHAWNRVTFSDGTERYVDTTNLGQDYFILVPWSHMEELSFKLK